MKEAGVAPPGLNPIQNPMKHPRTKVEKGSIWMAKNSGGPNFSARLARSGANSVMRMVAKSAPTKEEEKAAVSAWAPWPLRARGYPSNVVATDHGSPGMLKSTEVIAPPKSAPQ